ncbi:hypothetical protein [Lactococcus phage Nocturne116]|nr:hypothetical protein [Lactococcus phage Nocturne116]
MNPFSKRGLRDKLATQAANLIDEQIEISVTVRELFYKLFVV